jgi:hypothetical protein
MGSREEFQKGVEVRTREKRSRGLKENFTNIGIRGITCVFFNAGIRGSGYEGVVIRVLGCQENDFPISI